MDSCMGQGRDGARGRMDVSLCEMMSVLLGRGGGREVGRGVGG